MEISKDADKLICKLYQMYLESRDSGKSKFDSRFTGSAENMISSVVSDMNEEDVSDTCIELENLGLLNCQFADNVLVDSCLTDSAIFYMENRFKNSLSQLIDYISKIVGIIR